MATQLPDYKPAKTPGRPLSYPWDRWFNGGWWRLEQGRDFPGSLTNMAGYIRKAAKGRGYLITIHTEDKALVIQTRREDNGKHQRTPPKPKHK